VGGTAICQVTFSATAAGTYTLTASYGGDSTHAVSAGSTRLTVTTALTDGGPGASNPSGLSLPIGGGKPRGLVPPPGTIKIAAGTAKVSARHVAGVRLACSGSRGEKCGGILTLTAPIKVKVKIRTKVHKKTRTKTVTETELLKLGSVVYTVSARSTHAVSIKLSKRAFALLMKSRHHKLRASASAAGVVRALVLTPAHKPKPKRKHKHKHKRR
jgi:hypothetical protein